MTTAICTALEVKQRLSGDVPRIDGAWDTVIGDAIAEVSDLIAEEVRLIRGEPPGWDWLDGGSETRRYTGADGGSRLLLIDDAVQIVGVTLLDAQGNLVRTLTAGSDYLPYPLNGLPVTGLTLISGTWPTDAGAVSVTLHRGYAAAVPPNIRGAGIAETIRAYRAGQAGMDDRLGVTPFGQLVVSKALLQSTYRAISRYRRGDGFLRRSG